MTELRQAFGIGCLILYYFLVIAHLSFHIVVPDTF